MHVHEFAGISERGRMKAAPRAGTCLGSFYLPRSWCEGVVFLGVCALSSVIQTMSWNLEFLCFRPLEKLKVMGSAHGMVTVAVRRCLKLRTGPEFPHR